MTKCLDCKYSQAYRKPGNCRYEYRCEHPNQKYIIDYFKEHKILKLHGFLGFSRAGEFPVKTAPKWCPLKGADDNG